MDILIVGLLLAGTYALVAMGLNLQYGVARILNVANGEILVLGGLAAFWLFITAEISPILTIFLVAPIAFAGNWLMYQFLMAPLVRRAKNQGQLEVDSISGHHQYVLKEPNVQRAAEKLTRILADADS